MWRTEGRWAVHMDGNHYPLKLAELRAIETVRLYYNHGEPRGIYALIKTLFEMTLACTRFIFSLTC
jgi:hypothetical protein